MIPAGLFERLGEAIAAQLGSAQEIVNPVEEGPAHGACHAFPRIAAGE